MIFPIQVDLERARLRGTAFGVMPEDQLRPVDGLYELSTILVGRSTDGPRRETVAFKVNGVGPRQISEPYRVKTLTITAL